MNSAELKKQINKESSGLILSVGDLVSGELPILTIDIESLEKLMSILIHDSRFLIDWIEELYCHTEDSHVSLSYLVESRQLQCRMIVRGNIPSKSLSQKKVMSLGHIWPGILEREKEIEAKQGVQFVGQSESVSQESRPE